MAKDDLKRLFYRNETTFSLDKYVTKMKQTFNVLDNYNVPLYEEDKVGQILDNINCPKTIWKMRLISIDLATMLASRQIPHIYQLLYNAFYQ